MEKDIKACLALDGVVDIQSHPFDIPYPGATRKQVRFKTKSIRRSLKIIILDYRI
jgi:hypothetical protein